MSQNGYGEEEIEELKRQLQASAVSPHPPLPPLSVAPLPSGHGPPGPPAVSALEADRNQLEVLKGFLGQPDDRAQVRPSKIKVTRASKLVDAVWNLSDLVGLTAVDDFPEYEGAVGKISDIVGDIFFRSPY